MKVEILKNWTEELRPKLLNYPFKPYSWIKRLEKERLLSYLEHEIKDLIAPPAGEEMQKCWVLIAKEGKEICGLITLRIIDWDSSFFGFKVGNIDYFISFAAGEEKKELKIKNILLTALYNICLKEKIKMVSIRIDCRDLSGVHSLERQSFQLMTAELMYSWDKSSIPLLKTDNPPVKIREYQNEDLEKLLYLAQYFTTNRFYADSNISEEKARGVYENWIKNSCQGTFSGQDEVLVGEIDGEIVGFTTAKIEDKTLPFFGFKVGIPGLVAVAPSFRGREINHFLMSRAIISLLNKTEVVAAPSHITNIPMIRSETKIGAELVETTYVFHRWIR